MSDKLIIFDTTLRDGEQSPGASMTKDEKLRIARQLERLRVDVIEAGFAASSNGDFEAVKVIADHIRESTVCSLARANDRDIARAAEALKGAASSRIHTFIATSELHMEKKLRMTREQVLEQARLAVRFARNLCADVEFSPEDGYRSDPDFLCRVLEAAIAEGATTLNIPDTVGYAIPELYGQFLRNLRERIPNADKAVWSVHCHNDLGMAVANSLAGVMIGGARQVECTINGLGERAGNCSLEEVVMAVKTRRDYFGLDLRIDASQIVPASRLVAQTTGFTVQPNKAPATPTRSCVPRMWAGRRTGSCSASSPAATPSSSACRSWASSRNRKPTSMRPSHASRTWPTARATSSMRTSSR
jgi:2-isopropylmalate synthase